MQHYSCHYIHTQKKAESKKYIHIYIYNLSKVAEKLLLQGDTIVYLPIGYLYDVKLEKLKKFSKKLGDLVLMDQG